MENRKENVGPFVEEKETSLLLYSAWNLAHQIPKTTHLTFTYS